MKKCWKKVHRQSSLLNKLMHHLSTHEARAYNAEGFATDDNGSLAPEVVETDIWRVAFEEAGSVSQSSAPSPHSWWLLGNGDVNSCYSENHENGDVGSPDKSTLSRLPPLPPSTNLYSRY